MSSYIRLKDGDNYLYPEMYGVDTSNVLYSQYAQLNSSSVTDYTYTATQDCYFMGCNKSKVNTYLDGVRISQVNGADGGGADYRNYNILLKKGQKIRMVCYDSWSEMLLIVYGLKYHS